MVYAIKNVSNSIITLSANIEILPSGWYIIYDSTTFNIDNYFGDYINSSYSDNLSQNANYNINNNNLKFGIDGNIQSNEVYYEWFCKMVKIYKYYSQFKAQGLINLGYDIINNKMVIGTRSILVTDLPDNIPATKIGTGIITNEEFNTLNNINTNVTIQEQLDSKQDINTSRLVEYIQSTPSKLWSINHNMNCHPITSVLDNNEEEILATINYVDLNNLTISFSIPYTGRCIMIR